MTAKAPVVTVNDELVLFCGLSAAGKSASFMNLERPEGVMYFNCEAGKKLPFNCKFKQFTITNPFHVLAGIDKAESMPEVHTIIIESLNFLMDMFFSTQIKNAEDTQKGWGEYSEYFKDLMQQHVAKSTKNIIFTAHVESVYDKTEMAMDKKVPVQGKLGRGSGVEAYFSVIIGVKKVPIEELEEYKNPLLTITPADERLGYKHVYQTQLTKETVSERIRSPMGMWQFEETFINNDCQLVLDRLKEYYS